MLKYIQKRIENYLFGDKLNIIAKVLSYVSSCKIMSKKLTRSLRF